MAAGGYDPSLPVGSNTFRRSSSGIPYDMGPHAQARRTPPSPVISSRRISAPYDSYASSRAGPSHRDEFPNANNYRPDPNAWRLPPARTASAYYSRSPSPGRYDHSRGPELDTWGRPISPGSWQPATSSWRPPVPSPPSASRDRSHRDIMAQSMSQPLFEPSDTWKKSHDDRPARNEVPMTSSANRISAPRAPPRRPVSPPRNEYTSPYYTKENNYRPPPPSAPQSYRDTYGGPRENNYRPQYDDRTSWNQFYRGTSQLPSSATFRRDLGPPRNVSRDPGDRYPYRSYSPSPERRGRLPRRPNYGSRSRSASRSSRRASSPKVTSAVTINTYVASRSGRNRSQTRSRSRSRTRSLSSSDVASTRASQRSSREPAKAPQQQPPPSLPVKPSENANVVPTKPIASSVPVTIPVAQPKPVEKKLPDDKQQLISQSAATKQEERVISVPKQTDDIPTPASKAPSLLSKPQGSQTSTEPHIPEPSVPKVVPPSESPHIALSSTISQTSVSTTKVLEDASSKLAVPQNVGGTQAGVPFSSPLSSPARSVQLDADITPRQHVGDDGTRKVSLSAKVLEISDATTDDEDNLPNMSDARSIADALRIVVMTRLRCDRQTREERINPVLMANHSIAQPYQPQPSTSSEELVREVTQGERLDSRMKAFATTKKSLTTQFAIHQEDLSEKTERLREEYLVLHERWQAHCARLDNQSNKKSTKEAPTPVEEVVVPATSGRSTRRTAAMLGDAVRSDLEMEQIIASLGVEELTDPNHLALRNLATIPDMISVSHGQVDYLFDDTNNLVDNPEIFYDSSAGTDTWTDEEKEIFLEQFAANPKQFGIIASFLPAKTAAQCVAFYYLHKKKHVDFRKVVSLYAPGKRRRGGRRTDKQKGNALMADIRQHDDEVSLSHSGPTTRRKRAILPTTTKPISSRLSASQIDLTPTSTPTPDPEPEVRRRGRRPNATARIINTLVDDENGVGLEPKPAKRGRKGRKPKTLASAIEDSSTPTTVEGNTNESSSRRKAAAANAHWSDHDKSLFLDLLGQYGDDFKRIAASMPHKTTIQVNNYYKNNVTDLELDKIVANAPKRSPTPETASDAYADSSRIPGSGIMTPIVTTVTDLDRQLPLNGRAALQKVRDILNDKRTPSTSTSASSGDLSRTSQRHSGLTEATLQLGNTSDPSEQHRSHKPLQFTRFVPSGGTGSPANRDFPPVAPSSTFSFTSYSESSFKTRQAMPIVFYDQTGAHSSTGRAKVNGEDPHRNSFSGSVHEPDSGLSPHITAQRGLRPESQSQRSRAPNSPLSSTTSQSKYFTPGP